MKLIIGSLIAFSHFLTMVTGNRGGAGDVSDMVDFFPEYKNLGSAILILEPTPSQFNHSQSNGVMNAVNSFINASLYINNTIALKTFEMVDFYRCGARNLRRRHLIDADRFSTHIKVNRVVVTSEVESIPVKSIPVANLREKVRNAVKRISSEPSSSLLKTLGENGYGFITQADLLWSEVDNIPNCIPSLPPTNIFSNVPSLPPTNIFSNVPSLLPSSIFSNVPSLLPTHISSNIPSLTPTHVPDTISLPPASSPPSSLPISAYTPINAIKTISAPENNQPKYIIAFTTVGFVALAGIIVFLWRHSRKVGSVTVSNTPDNMNGSKIKELKGLADIYESEHESDSESSHIANMLLAATKNNIYEVNSSKGTKLSNGTPIYRKELNSWRNVDHRQTPDVVPLTSNVSLSTTSTSLSRNVSISGSAISRTDETFEQDEYWDPDDNDTGSCDKTETDDETQDSDTISQLIYLSDIRQQERTHS